MYASADEEADAPPENALVGASGDATFRSMEEREASQAADLGEIAQQLAQLAAALRVLKDQPIHGSQPELAAPPADERAAPVEE
ncbi:MAG: hypothetical protein ACK4P4_22365 [Allorhizobium sp.]